MRCADFCRAVDSRLNSVSGKDEIGADCGESVFEVSGHVFTEYPEGFKIAYNPVDVRPDMARVIFSKAQPGVTERLAWVSRSNDMYEATPRFRIECGNVRPDRELLQRLVFHSGDHTGNGEACLSTAHTVR